MDAFLETVTLLDVVGSVGGLVVLYLGFTKVWPVLAKLKDLIDDFAGEPARKGVPARPGLMERMEAVERMATSADYHSRPNGGGSAYDALMREVRGLHTRLDDFDVKLDSHITLSGAERAALRRDVDIVLVKRTDKTQE